MAKEFRVGQLIRIKGTKCEGTIKMIESEKAPTSTMSKWSSVKDGAFAYVTLNKGMTFPTMRTFQVQTYGTWNLAKVPYEDLEERSAENKSDVYALIKAGDLAGLKLLKPVNLNKKPGTVELKHSLNSLGYAIKTSTKEIIEFLYKAGVEVPNNKAKDNYHKVNALSLLLENNILTIEEKLELRELFIVVDPKLNFGRIEEYFPYSWQIKDFPLFYAHFGKENLMKKSEFYNPLTSAIRSGLGEAAKQLILDGFDLDKSIKFLTNKIEDSGSNKGKSYLEISIECFKQYSKKITLDDLIEYAKNPLLFEANESIKKEIKANV